ncbi:MAG: hypothetical protein H7Z74_04025 [Anaerolineae bacterium]|nr:hypothetical protein [Gemmatimonadaceae bacterium]
MRFTCMAAAAFIASGAAYAQQPDTTRRPPVTKADSLRADSIAAADSIQLVRELERIGNEPRPVVGAQAGGTPGPQNPRLLPDISAIGDLIADFSPDGSTQESANRFDIREVEIAVQAAVDPYFRGDVILGLSDLEGIAIEEAYLTTLSLPNQFQIRGGRFHMPVGKQNTTHRAELHTIEYPYVIQRFLGAEGLKGTGLWVSRIFAPFGFFQELQLTVVDRFGGEAHGHEEEEGHVEPVAEEPANKRLSGLGYSARFRNYWDLSEATNIELSASAATGKQIQGVECFGFDDPGDPISCALPGDATGVNVRQSLVGADFTFRWRPLQQGLYKSFIFQSEYFRQLNDKTPPFRRNPGVFTVYDGPVRNFDGAYAFARYQVTRRAFVGGRFDWLRDPEADGETFSAASAYLTFFPSEFSKLVAGYERTFPSGDLKGLNRVLIQATFALGPHRPHPF